MEGIPPIARYFEGKSQLAGFVASPMVTIPRTSGECTVTRNSLEDKTMFMLVLVHLKAKINTLDEKTRQ